MTTTLTAWEILVVQKSLSFIWQQDDQPVEWKGLERLIKRFKDAKYVTIETS